VRKIDNSRSSPPESESKQEKKPKKSSQKLGEVPKIFPSLTGGSSRAFIKARGGQSKQKKGKDHEKSSKMISQKKEAGRDGTEGVSSRSWGGGADPGGGKHSVPSHGARANNFRIFTGGETKGGKRGRNGWGVNYLKGTNSKKLE